MWKFLTLLIGIVLSFVAVQSFYFGIEHDKYCKTVDVDARDWEYIQRKMKSRDPYNVIHLDQDLLNYALEKAQKEKTIEYEVCAKIDQLRNRLKLFIAKGPLWWFTITLKASENEPFIEITDVHYGVIPMPDFVKKTLQSEVINNYRTYFEKKIPTRKIDKLEIQDEELIIYTKYY